MLDSSQDGEARSICVYHLSTDSRLTFINKGSTVWRTFSPAYKEYEDRSERAETLRARGHRGYVTYIYEFWVPARYVKKSKYSVAPYELLRGARVDRAVSSEDLTILRMEAALERRRT